MTSGSLGLRSSGSYGSLQQQQIQNAILSLPIQNTPPLSSRKPPKMLKEKDRFSHWIRKFAPRKKVGMLLLCIVSAAVFMWVLYVGKGEDAREPAIANSTIRIRTGGAPDGTGGLNGSIISRNVEPDESASTEMAPSPPSSPGRTIGMNESNISQNVEPSESASEEIAHPPPPSSDGTSGMNENTISQNVEPNENPSTEMASPPPPLIPTPINVGYVLPPGNPCEHFTLPPPPADKKRTGPRPCPVCYLPLEDAIALMPNAPSYSPVIKELTYIHEENLTKSEFGGSEFGGYPSLRQRNDSYDIRESMSVHCGFVRGVRPGQQTGFDIGDVDLLEMESCRGVVVASAIFGAFDLIRQPKNISEYSRANICFHMFVDEETEAFLHNSAELGNDKKVGLWRIIVVRNLPYSDPRRNGKIPKLLVHRLFPNARYSLWVDAKLELVVDPVQILERFLWRKNASFAISRHYRRFDVFIEAEANKAAGKYDNASIDFQIDFYKNEGLTPFSADKWPITSDVPEGCVIVREHIPISNLFTCLWFQEVDRFTSRDQISFSTVRDKIARKSNYTINMFLDCERRNFVIQNSDDEDEDEESEGEEEDDEELESEQESSVALSDEDKQKEAAEIGYTVIGPLQESDRVFKWFEPVFAVVQIGSHQFKVSNGDCIYTERLKYCDVSDKLILNKVLMLGSMTQTIIGRPILPDAAVHAVVEEHALDAKVIIFKKKRRKNYRRKKGHRQELTKLRITDIQGIEKPEKIPPLKTEKKEKPGKQLLA